MNYRESNKVICLQYRQYSCGRFVSNILSYNKNFLPQYNLEDSIPLSVYSDINYKHEIILNTLPSTENLKKWRDYELGCDKFYGIKMYDGALYRKIYHAATGTMNVKNFNQLLSNIKNKAKVILETTNFFVFIVSHYDICTKLIKEIFPNSILIEFINDEYINHLSKKIKTDEPNNNNPIKFSNNLSYKFDIGTLLCETSFFNEINKLLIHLKCEDTTLDPKVYDYYKKYVALYEPYLNKEQCKK
jgi:hypothetical protein